MSRSKITLIAEYDPLFEPHAATDAALTHSGVELGVDLETTWVSTECIDEHNYKADGFLIAPGSPYKNMGATLSVIKYARENNIPCLGTCGGFQHMVIEYARNVLGFEDAHHAEYDPYASNLFVSELVCSLAGREMEINLTPGSLVSDIYGATTATEVYYCNFGVNPFIVPLLTSKELEISGSDTEGEVRVIELPNHPFYIGTLFVPQAQSTENNPHPLITAFIETMVGLEYDRSKPS